MNYNYVYSTRIKYLSLWIVLLYGLGSLFLVIQALPNITIFSIENSLIREGSKIILADHSIVKAITLGLLWPLLLGVQLTFGVFLSAEVVGYEYSSNLPLLFALYYWELFLEYLPIALIGVFCGAFVFVLYNKNGKQSN